jgi:hypothetical protein
VSSGFAGKSGPIDNREPFSSPFAGWLPFSLAALLAAVLSVAEGNMPSLETVMAAIWLQSVIVKVQRSKQNLKDLSEISCFKSPQKLIRGQKLTLPSMCYTCKMQITQFMYLGILDYIHHASLFRFLQVPLELHNSLRNSYP